MSENTPAERGRDELREKLRHLTRDPGPLGSAVCALLKAAEAELPVMVMPDESRAIIDLLAQQEAPPILSRKHANEIAYFLRRPDMAHDAKRERLASLVERAGAAPQEAREPELLGYVVERQLTTGEWMRVWRGSTMWFDHDEAVLERDAYALDGIPTRIRPVYLGAPAPASGEPSGADAAVREAPPISDTAVARIIEAVEAHCGMGRGAWDMVAARDLVEGFAAALGADTRRIDAIDSVLLPTAPGAPEEGRCGLPSPVRRYGPCILRRGHGGPGAHQHDETGRIMQAYHAPGYYRQWAADGMAPDTQTEGDDAE